MSAIDAAFLAMEAPSQPRHVGVLMLFAPGASGPLTADEVRAVASERLAQVPSARRVPVESRLGLTRPSWRDVARLDVDEHVTVTTLPTGADEHAVAAVVARIHAERLDRHRPLWELHVLERLDDGRVAVYAKVHSAALDDSTGVELMTALLDHEAGGRASIEAAVPDVPDAAPPDEARMAPSTLRTPARRADPLGEQLRLAAGFPGRLARRAAHALNEQLPGLRDTATEVTRRTPGMEAMARFLPPVNGDVEHRTVRAPRLSLNAPIGPERVVSVGRVAVADVLEVKRRADVGFTDVVVATLTGALRRWLLAIDELPTSPVVAMVPVLVADRRGGPAHISGIVTPLPTHVADPHDRLTRTAETLGTARRRHHAHPATLQQDLAKFAPPVVSSLVGRVRRGIPSAGFVSPAVNVGITNMPGPRHRVTLAGRPLESSHPVLSVTDVTPLHLGIQSGPEWVGFGAVGCPEGVEDVDHLLEATAIELGELLSAVTPSRRHRRSSHAGPSGPAVSRSTSTPTTPTTARRRKTP